MCECKLCTLCGVSTFKSICISFTFLKCLHHIEKQFTSLSVFTYHHLCKSINIEYLLQIKKSITVGIIGLPNVGKSSLINSLKRSHVVNVGATPGLTRSMQEVQLDKNVKLLDCPGVVLLRSSENDASIALRNCKRIEKLDDPVGPGNEILSSILS